MAEPLGVPDIGGPGLRVVFCGINPGMRSGQLGQHFARPGNRFWKLLAAAGLTPRLLQPVEQDLLPGFGVGITNLVEATTARADELTTAQLRAGGVALDARVAAWAPGAIAVLGAGAYRTAYRRPKAAIGLQEEQVGGVPTWLLPNPSGLQASYQLPEMTALWRTMAATLPA